MAEATTKVVISAVDNASTTLRTISSQVEGMRSSFGSLTGVVAGLGTALAGLSIVSHLRGTIEAADQIGKLAQKAGLTVEAMSALSYAAKLADVDNQQLAAGMGKLSKSMTEAAAGTGDAGKFFKALGVSVTDASGKLKTNQAVFGEVADKFAAMEDGATKTAVAMGIFGKSGAQLIPLLNDGAAGMKRAAEEAKRLGIVMSKDMAEKAQQVNDNFTRLRAASEGLSISLAQRMLPGMVEITNAMTEAAKESGLLKAAWVGLGGLGAALFTDTFSSAEVKIKNLKQDLADLERHRKDADGQGILFHMLFGKKDEIDQKIASVRAQIAGLEKLQADAARKPTGPTAAVRDAKARADAAAETQRRLNALLGGSVKAEADKFLELLNRINGVDTKFQEELLTLQNGLKKGRISIDDYRVAIEKLINKQPFAVEGSRLLAESLKAEAEASKQKFEASSKALDTLDEEIKKQREHNQEIGLTREQLALLVGARDDETIAIKEQQLATLEKTGTDASEIESLRIQIQQLRELRSLRADGAAREIAAEAAKDALDAWQKTADDINSSLTDALLRGFESGKDFAQNFRDTVVNMFKTLILRPVISAIISPVGQAIAGGIGLSGVAGAANAASGISSGVNLLSGASGFLFGGAGVSNVLGLSSLGGAIGGEFGAGLAFAGTQGIGTGVIGGLGEIFGGGSILSGLGAALPGIGIAIAAIAALSSIFGDEGENPKAILNFSNGVFGGATVEGGYNASAATNAFGQFGALDNRLHALLTPDQIAAANARLAATTQREYAIPPGSEESATKQLLTEFVKQKYGAIFGEINAELENQIKGFGEEAYTEVSGFVSGLVEIYSKLETQQNSVEAVFGEPISFDALIAAKEGTENVVQTFGRLASVFTATNQAALLLGQNAATAFGAVGLASTAARQRLVDLAGGIDALGSLATNYANKMLTDAQRTALAVESATQQLEAGFTSLGLAVPQTHEEFTSLVSSLDLSSEAGAKTYTTLLGLVDAFTILHGTAQDAAGGIVEATTTISAATETLASSVQSFSVDIADIFGAAQDQVDKSLSRVTDLLNVTSGGDESKILAGQIATLTTLVANASAKYTETVNAAGGYVYADAIAYLQTAELARDKIASLTADLAEYTKLEAANPGFGKQLLELEHWYKDQQSALAGHNDALLLLDEAYQIKREEILQGGLSQGLDATNKTIRDWLDRVVLGGESPLTNAQKLEAARNQYISNLIAAQGGDATAGANITQFADAYLAQARNYFASSGAYTDIFNTVYTQLATLAGITATPITQADAQAMIATLQQIAAMQAETTAAITTQTGAVNDTTAAVQQQTTTLTSAAAAQVLQ